MKIFLKSLSLTYFKGIRSFKADFGKETNIFGDNATGKTTIMDAFLWLLFGKDSTDRKDFEVKTLDANNKVIPQLEHEVEGVLMVGDREIVLKRVFREKWEKKRGTQTHEFTGNQTLYFWNDVPLQQQEYQAKVNDILEENIFKLITNTLYFNSLKWQDRRKVLMEICGDVTNEEIATLDPRFRELLDSISGKSFDEFRKQITARKTKLKDALEQIPTRIDEANRSKPEELDFKAIEKQITEKEAELTKIEEGITDEVKTQKQSNQARMSKQQQVFDLKSQVQKLTQGVRESFNKAKHEREQNIISLRNDMRVQSDELARILSDKNNLEKRKENLDTERKDLRAGWTAANSEQLVFDENEFKCPACHREFETSDIESKKAELTTNFNNAKSSKLKRIEERGATITTEIEEINVKLADLAIKANDLNISHKENHGRYLQLDEENVSLNANAENEIAKLVAESDEIISLNKQITTLEEELSVQVNSDTSEWKNKKTVIASEVDSLKRQLNTKEQIKQVNERIQQLQQEESNLAQQLAELEKTEFTILEFDKAKSNAIEQRLNGRFSLVRFKLFEQQINGGEIPCCETLINGVPFSDANNAARINAGLDIINTLCAHHQVWAPVIIDNAESVNELIPVRSQLIRLVVSNHKKLTVSVVGELEKAVA